MEELTELEKWTVTITAAYIGAHFFDGFLVGLCAAATFAPALGIVVFWIKNQGRFL